MHWKIAVETEAGEPGVPSRKLLPESPTVFVDGQLQGFAPRNWSFSSPAKSLAPGGRMSRLGGEPTALLRFWV